MTNTGNPTYILNTPGDTAEVVDELTLESMGPGWLDYADLAVKVIGVIALLAIAARL